MKFAQQWRAQIAVLPQQLQLGCLDYKRYKKLTSSMLSTTATTTTTATSVLTLSCTGHSTVRAMLNELKQDVRRVHAAFVASPPQEDQHALYAFAKLNSTCLRKICKRLSKRMATPLFWAWFQHVQAQRKYAFMSPMHQAACAVKCGQVPRECPICLDDDVVGRQALVLRCGHVLCCECALGMLGVSKKRGTFYNLVAYGAYMQRAAARCPVCRDAEAFHEYLRQ